MMLNVYCERIGQTWYGAVFDGTKVVATNFARSKEDALRPICKGLPYEAPFETIEKPSALSMEVFRAMSAILDGRDVSFNFELDMSRIPRTTRRVLELMSLIPTGYAATYGGLAKVSGTGPRVAGHACATNPFPPIVPCHRVVARDLSLGGYGGGLKLKWEILRKEDRGFKDVSNVKISGKLLPLFPISCLKPPA
ncbi:MAG TPA: methylated-DNA--[protein]-cysteine S-methyltransferase [Candidatus Bathyarchaeia archaeon]|nr:methylated-DNA--[protein]-cysteine S-methyltransferase [Candidatus Bathyarchaeia archaeon]